jgi:hypothetical protein
VPKRSPAPHLIAERQCQGRGPPTASPDFTPIAEHAFRTRETALRHAGAGTHALLATAMAHSVSMMINPGVQGRFRRESKLGAVQMLHPFCLRAVHLLPQLTWT